MEKLRGARVDVKCEPTLGYPMRFAEGDPAVDGPLWALSELAVR